MCNVTMLKEVLSLGAVTRQELMLSELKMEDEYVLVQGESSAGSKRSWCQAFLALSSYQRHHI